MLVLEKMASNDYLLTDNESNESIILPSSLVLDLKAAVKTAGDLVNELYKLYGGNVKWREILDKNLKKSSGINTRNRAIDENIMLLLKVIESIQ